MGSCAPRWTRSAPDCQQDAGATHGHLHGRGIVAAAFRPGVLQTAVAAVEAFIGLLIEIVFIATFTQRFFAR